jgi:multiple sugar transport system substrate-binding protein
MARSSISGLTWDHPRGFAALDAASALPEAADLNLQWQTQSLEGFESHPIGELCEQYDLVVLDHPHVGEAVEAGCLWPLEELFSAQELQGWAAQSVGASYESYAWQGRQWALPLDAATQVAAARADLIDGALPASWTDVVDLSSDGGVCLSIAGPHAMLSFCSMMTAFGSPPEVERSAAHFVDEATALEVLDVMATLVGRMNPATHALNPIQMLEFMSRNDEVRFCPLIYGYVNYATRTDERAPVRFVDVPVARPAGRHGSTLGGTGIALSRRSKPSRELLDHLRFLMSESTQVDFIPAHHGQPSHRAAWTHAGVNDASGNFYRDTLATIEQAYVRPRYSGYIAFQTRASSAIRAALVDGTSHRQLIAALNAGFKQQSVR